MGSQQTASKESRYPIFVASEQRSDASGQANIQPAATKVTNIGYRLSLEASILPAANQDLQIYAFNCLFFYIMSFCISSKNKR